MVSKKGLSDIVTNVLIILLVLVAIGIVWAFVRPSLDSISGVEGASNLYSVVLSIDAQSVVVNSAQSTVTLKVGRNENSASLAGIEVILADASGAQRAIRNRTAIGPLESRTIVVSYAGTGLGVPTSVSVAPVIGLNGEERVGSVTDMRQISAQAPGPGQICTPNSQQSCTFVGPSNSYPGTQTCNAGGTAWNACATTLSCGDSQISGTETCEANVCKYGTSGQYLGDFTNGGSCSTSCRSTPVNSCWCYADLTNDGVLDSADEAAMTNAVGGGGSPANGADVDCNQDGGADGSDEECLRQLIAANLCHN